MPERTVSLTLKEREIVEIERIVMDHDKDEALAFVRDVIMRKVEEGEKHHCKPPEGIG